MKPIPPGSSSRRSSPPDAQRPVVLYVEDDDGNREVAAFRLAKKYDVRLAATDREACDLVRQLGDGIMLVLLDIELKGSRLSGVDLAKLLRGRLEKTKIPDFAERVPAITAPIIFVTAYGERYGGASELLTAGGNEIITKPVDFVALHTAMARAYLRRIS